MGFVLVRLHIVGPGCAGGLLVVADHVVTSLGLNGNLDGMITTIDMAGRGVSPKPLRDQLGIRGGEVDITVNGAKLRIQPLSCTPDEVDGTLLLPRTGTVTTNDEIRELRAQDIYDALKVNHLLVR